MYMYIYMYIHVMLISTRTCAEHVARCAFNRVFIENCSYSLSGYTYARLLDIFFSENHSLRF